MNVQATRRFAEITTVFSLLVAVLAFALAKPRPVPGWFPVLGLWGLIFPVLAWRYYHLKQSDASGPSWEQTVRKIFIVGALTSCISAIAFAYSRLPVVMLGLAGFLLIAGALWPNAHRAQRFKEGASGE